MAWPARGGACFGRALGIRIPGICLTAAVLLEKGASQRGTTAGGHLASASCAFLLGAWGGEVAAGVLRRMLRGPVELLLKEARRSCQLGVGFKLNWK